MILNVENKLYEYNGKVAVSVKTKIDLVLKKVKGFKTLLKIRSIIDSEYETTEDFNITLIPGQFAPFKYAPITSCDVKRIFSQYKSTLRSNRWSFIFEKNMYNSMLITTYNSRNNEYVLHISVNKMHVLQFVIP